MNFPGSEKETGGRPANDPVQRFKLLLLQRYYNLSDAQTEDQVSDRLSFQKLAGGTVTDKAPDAHMRWAFREALVRAAVDGDAGIKTRELLSHYCSSCLSGYKLNNSNWFSLSDSWKYGNVFISS